MPYDRWRNCGPGWSEPVLGQGSMTNNTTGMREVYRGSKAALNMFMCSFAARQSDTARAFVLMAPG